jgi:CDP-diacylglycerol--serine O-phosphatidyltransferase
MAYRLTPKASARPAGNAERLERRRRSLRRRVGALPAMFTLGNLLCGFGAVFFASRPGLHYPHHATNLTVGALLIFLGMVFDALDGRVARLTRHTTDMGLELDSMADMVTFGVAPAFLVVQLVQIGAPFLDPVADSYFDRTTLMIACIYVACAALRLARFNVEVKGPAVIDHMYFKGLPSPGAAGTVASLVLLHQSLLGKTDPLHWTVRAAAVGMVAVMLLTAIGMVSRLRYSHLINRYVRGRLRFATVAYGVVIILLLFINLWPAVCGMLVLYALSAPCAWLWRHATGRRPAAAPGAAPQTAPPVLMPPGPPEHQRNVM